MVWLKACPKCHGDLFLDQDSYGKFKTCVQCGYMRDLAEASADDPSLTATATGSKEVSFQDFTAMMAAD